MKRLYDERDRWTTEATHFSADVCQVLRPLIQKKHAEGYSIRDIELIVHSDLAMLCAEIMVRQDIDRRKAEREAKGT